MDNLQVYASFAEIFAASTIIVGAIFGFIQFRDYRRRSQIEVTAEMCRKFAEPELARAVNLLKHLPDDISWEEMKNMDKKYEEAAQIVGMSFETMGLLVYKRVASLELVQELTGGLLLMMWRKIRVWLRTTRVDSNNPRFGEWVEWLADRIEEKESDMVPAYEAHTNWTE